jgi:HTH-type transcriptional regulator/antitoxin HigA
MIDDLKPIRTKADHKAALAEIERLWGAGIRTPEGDRLDVLVTLVEAFESKHFNIELPDPIAAIEFRMEQEGLKRADLEEMIGSRGRVAEVLNRKRNLSIEMIRRLHDELGIPAQVLIQPTVDEAKRLRGGGTSVRSSTSVLANRGGARRTAAVHRSPRAVRKK